MIGGVIGRLLCELARFLILLLLVLALLVAQLFGFDTEGIQTALDTLETCGEPAPATA
jgi:hypothetical protein